MSDRSEMPLASVGSAAASQPAAMPKGLVLSYLTNVSTPTRVRVVAARSVFVLGLVELVPAGIGFVWTALSILDRYNEMRGMGWVFFTWPDLYDYFGDSALILMFLACICANALTLTLLAGPVRQGRRAPCTAVAWLVTPTMIGVLLATPMLALIGIYEGLDFAAVHPELHFAALGLVLLVPVGALLTVLLMDLRGFLLWIRRHQWEEKPAVAFLPQRAAGQAAERNIRGRSAASGQARHGGGATTAAGEISASAMESGPQMLPKAHVLSHLANVSTPTRVRKVAATGVVVVALLNMAMAVGILAITVWEIHENWWYGRPTLDNYMEVVQKLGCSAYPANVSNPLVALVLITGWILRAIMLLMLVIAAVAQVILARAVYLGRPMASRVCLVMAMATMFVAGGATVILGSYALVYGVGRKPEWAVLWWLLVVPLGVLVVLLLKDLSGFLLWIARASMADKAPVSFLPGGK